jgi:hypothetical protein
MHQTQRLAVVQLDKVTSVETLADDFGSDNVWAVVGKEIRSIARTRHACDGQQHPHVATLNPKPTGSSVHMWQP